ncbi:hypothetical protein [Mycolicibacterium iranicum]|uniref:Uncharacterized protein n=1 Tax=Mycolicibacterium iranicum TaxID=912594 RepID=A0A1X1WAI6_MYCIR|nr:hypothetical protein [Mycolicibacterium iranicum]MCZ0730284.1 hypothetical protein [Mycolicibacterium iranicum]ORV83625.1 hypothetical protein AWC12_24905 [Mycolicibacterium iranicum]
MRDSVVFAQVKTLQGMRRTARVSAGALEIHVRAVADRIGTPYPAFVPDERLDAIAPGRVTTMAAIELCMAGMWYRASDGYVVADLDLIEHFAQPVRRRWLRAIGRFFKEYLLPV